MNELATWDPFKAIAPFESLFEIPNLFRPVRAGVKKEAILTLKKKSAGQQKRLAIH